MSAEKKTLTIDTLKIEGDQNGNGGSPNFILNSPTVLMRSFRGAQQKITTLL